MRVPPVAALVALVVAAAALYATALRNPFISDDETLIAGNPTIARPSALGFAGLWTADYWTGIEPDGTRTRLTVDDNLWRPVTILSFWLDARLGAVTPWRFRLTNVVLHALSAWLVGLLCARLMVPWAGAVAALVVLVHPVATDVVNRVVGRADILVLLGIAGALAAQADAIRRGWSAGRVLLVACFAAVALGAKESGLAVVPIAAVHLWVASHGRRARGDARGAVARAAAVAIVAPAVLYVVARTAVVGWPDYRPDGVWDLIGNPLWDAGLGARIPAAAALACSYLAMLLAPWPLLAFDVPARLPTWSDAEPWLGLATVATIAGAALWGLRRRDPLALAAAWWLASFAVVSQLATPIGAYREVRFAYPMLGAVALALARLAIAVRAQARPRRTAAAVASGAAVMVAVVMVLARNAEFHDFGALLEADLRRQPDNPAALIRLASAYEGGRRDAEAGAVYARVTALAPGSAQAWYERAGWEAAQGRVDEARPMYERAVMLAPRHYPALTALATLAIADGRLADAERLLDQAERAAPADPMVALYRAVLDEQHGDRAAARARLTRIVAEHPRFAPARNALATLDGTAPADGSAAR